MEEAKGVVIEEVSSFAADSVDGSADFSVPNSSLMLANKTKESYMSTVKQCEALWQLALPQFGMYSYEYEWANLISAYRCNAKPLDSNLRQNNNNDSSRDDLEFE